MRRSWAVAVTALFLTASTTALAGALDLTILHTNDVHGRLAATPPFGSVCSALPRISVWAGPRAWPAQ